MASSDGCMASLPLVESRRITKHSPSTYVQRHTSHLEGQAPHGSLVNAPNCKPYAIAIRLTRVWCVLAMVIQEYFDIGGVIGMTVRGMYAYYVCCWLGGRLSSGGEATSAVCGGSSIIAQ